MASQPQYSQQRWHPITPEQSHWLEHHDGPEGHENDPLSPDQAAATEHGSPVQHEVSPLQSASATPRESAEMGYPEFRGFRDSTADLSLHSPMSPAAPRHMQSISPATLADRKKETNSQPSEKSLKGKQPMEWWWWWEIAATILSIVSMCLILVVLFMANNRALAAWPIRIQPNSLIAVFTTVGKSAMMVPIASCISQLKWRHFQLRPHRLSHLQTLDDASRGPWGSLMLLLNVRTAALTAGALAVVSLLALGVDPSAQQILDFPPRDTKLSNASAEIGVATQYYSKAFKEALAGESGGASDFSTTFNPDVFVLESSIIDGLSGSVFQPNFQCPGDECSWDDFTTLAVCGEYRNLTDLVKPSCTGETSEGLKCSYNLTASLGLAVLDPTMDPLVMTFSYQEGPTSPAHDVFRSVSAGAGNFGAMMFGVRGPVSVGASLKSPPPTTSFYGGWYWCARTYHNLTATPSGISVGQVSAERLVESDTLIDDGVSKYILWNAPSTNATYNITTNVDLLLNSYLGHLLARSLQIQYPPTNTFSATDSLDLQTFLLTADMEKMTSDLADTLSNQLRSTSPGDNLNGTSFLGDVFIHETYIYVRWPWIILPLAETLLTAVLLIVSILLTKRQPLFKTSAIALLVHGLEGWRPEEVEVGQPETEEKLEHLAAGLTARFSSDPDGRLKFVRAG